MWRVMVPPVGTVVAGVNTRTGLTVEPWLNWLRVMDIKAVIAFNPEIAGNVPVVVVSMTTGMAADKSLEVPAAMLVKAACSLNGVVNFVMMKTIGVAAFKVPVVSLTVNKEPDNAAVQVAEAGTMTAQTLGAAEVSKAMPAPDSVMMIPALVPTVMAPVGVNEKVAVVAVALTEDASVIARPLIHDTDGNVPVAVVSMTVGVPAEKSLEVPAAMLVKAACPLVGVVNFVMVKVMAVFAL
jgi:hypothetical protein